MEDPAILKMNIDHFKRLLEIEADPTKRQTDPKLIRETEEKLQQDRLSSGAIPQTGLSRRPAQATTAAATASAQPNRHRPRPLLLRLQNQRCARPLWPPCTSSVRALPLQPVILHPPFDWRKPTPLWRRRH